MRELLCLAIFLLLSGAGRGFAQVDTLWTCRLAPAGVPAINGATALADGGLAVTGTLEGATDGNVLVARISATGSIVWMRAFGQSGLAEQGSAIVELANGHLLLVGGQSPEDGASNVVLLMGLSATGDSLWSKMYYGGGQMKANDVIRLADGNIAVTGYRLGLDGAHSDLWLLKCDGAGDTLWTQTIGGGETDVGCKISEAANGNLRIGGHSRTGGTGEFDFWLTLTNSSGEGLHGAFYGPPDTRERCASMSVSDSGIFLGGYTLTVETGNYDGYVARANTAGEFQWGNTYSRGFPVEQIRGMAPQMDGGALCVGWAGQTESELRPWILSVCPDGQIETSRIDSSIANGWYTGIVTIPSGGYFLYGGVVDGAQTKGYVARTLPPGGISGTVTNPETGDSLGGVTVHVVGNPHSAVTDAQGWFAIELPSGTYDIYSSGRCLSPDTAHGVTVSAGELTPVNLHPGMAVLAPCPLTSLNLLVHNEVPDTTPFVIRNNGNGPMDYSVIAQTFSPTSAWLRVVPAYGVVPPHSELVVGICVTADTANTAAGNTTDA